METITDLENQLHSGIDEFVDKIIHIDGNGLFLTESDIENIKSLSFHNCIFTGTLIEFEDINRPDFKLGFFDGEIKVTLDIKNCNFERLGFRDVKSSKSIYISGSYQDFFLRNNSLKEKKENLLSANITFSHLKISQKFELDFINHVKGEFRFSDVEISISDSENIINFENSTFNDVEFFKCKFQSKTSFKEMSITEICEFEICEFKKVDFNNSNFKNLYFNLCDFNSTCWFENFDCLINSCISFTACEFKGFSLFNKSKFNFLNIDRCTFDKSSSFTDAEFNSIKLFEVKFGGGAYFDEMKINNVIDKSYLNNSGEKILEWKRTLRAIKQELQKTENKIDFNRFRGYELAAHYEELNYKDNFKDVAILWATKITTDFGINWEKAFWFTLKWGFVFFTLFFVIENCNNDFDIKNWSQFTSGFFRFFLVTDFFNPLVNDRVYLTNPLSWVVFIFGKIVIAFGIYEMIQSFRKFKA